MGKTSAGILLYRFVNNEPEILLVHPGGPLHAKKDIGAWSIPKGEYTEGEDPLTVAKREFEEETGQPVKAKHFTLLTPVKQKGGKTVYAWAAQGDLDTSRIISNTFKMEWPPRSGKWQDIPEIDRAEWFPIAIAKQKINPAQAAFIDELMAQWINTQ